ncbi:MAG: STIV orfB116 family protein [Conexivisphaera sp.]
MSESVGAGSVPLLIVRDTREGSIFLGEEELPSKERVFPEVDIMEVPKGTPVTVVVPAAARATGNRKTIIASDPLLVIFDSYNAMSSAAIVRTEGAGEVWHYSDLHGMVLGAAFLLQRLPAEVVYRLPGFHNHGPGVAKMVSIASFTPEGVKVSEKDYDVWKAAQNTQQPTPKLYLLNSPVVPLPLGEGDGVYQVKRISKAEAQYHIKGRDLMSAIGHEATARALSTLLGVKVEVSRAQVFLHPGEEALVFALRQRLPEGQVLFSEFELNQIGYDLYLIRRVA